MIFEKGLSRSIRVMFLGSLAITGTATAQNAEPEPQARVVVTGSRIASPNADSPSPLQVLTAADIAASGAINLQELLLKNPTMGTPTVSRTNSNFQTSSVGVSTVDLRNLGTSRTLVLINGRRVVSGIPGEATVDLNTIPVDFIERVEMLTGGASATYGSDAVAGVVNIILKRNFSGISMDAQLGRSSEGDDKRRKVSLTFGTTSADGRSNIMGHLGWTKEGEVRSKDRERSAVDQISKLVAGTGTADDIFTPQRPFNSSFAPQGRFFHDTGSYTYDRNGNPIPFSSNGTATVPASGFNRSEFRYIAVPTDRYLMSTSGNLAINDNHSLFLEGTYAATRTQSVIEPYPLGAEDIYPATGGQVPAEFLVNGTLQRNPVVPQYLWDRISDTDGDGLRDYYFTRRMAEVGTRGNIAERDTFRVATGVKGTVLERWNYEVFGVYGSTKEAQTSTGQVNVLNFRNALEAITDANDANGNGSRTDAICRDANARTQGCVPINVFGWGTISPEALKYVNAPGTLQTKVTQKILGGSINGDVYQLPAGAVGLAGGFEYRKEDSSSVPDPLTQAGLNAGNATPPVFGDFSVKEIFAEARVPILKDKPFAKNLSALVAARVGDYSTIGNAKSWNLGFEWTPVTDLKFRTTRSLSTRAPNIGELFQPPSQDFPTGIVDPCVGVTATSSGARSDACRAAPGVMANIQANGSFTVNQSDIQGISGFNRGNPGLQEEKGRSTTIGMVYTPRSAPWPWLRRFVFTADYFDIKISDAIVSTPRQFALDQCYGGGGTQFCSLITRRPRAIGANSAGSLEFVDLVQSNSGGTVTEGVDVTAAWADQVGPGRLAAHLAYTYVRKGYDIPLPGADQDPWADEVGASKHKAVLTLGYKWRDWNFTTYNTYIGAASLDDQFLAQYDLAPGSKRVKRKIYTDFQVTYAMRKNVELYMGMFNAFDTEPPPIISGLPANSTGAETDAGTYDAIGRRVYIGLRFNM
jgi:outer membrane receptor protein involved in Fe transport